MLMRRCYVGVLICLTLVVSLLRIAVPAQASPLAFAIDNVGGLYSIDLTTATATLIGTTSMAGRPGGLALSSSGVLFATDWNFSSSFRSKLYSIDPETAETTAIGETGAGLIFALDFNGTTLFGSQFKRNPRISSMNTATGESGGITNFGDSNLRIDALTALSSSTMLVMTRLQGSHNVLRSIDINTGVTGVPLGASRGPVIGAMDFASDGNLYGVDFTGGVWQINPTTGERTAIGNTGNHYWFGLAAIPSKSP